MKKIVCLILTTFFIISFANTASASSFTTTPEASAQTEKVQEASSSETSTPVQTNESEENAVIQENKIPSGNSSTVENTTDVTEKNTEAEGTHIVTNADTAAADSIVNSGNPVNAPSITSDQADYAPGALVTLTGEGWTGDSEVKIVVEDNSSPAQVWRLEKAVQVTSGGGIELQFKLPEWYVPQYKVTAFGLTTQRAATTTFTDSRGAYTLKFSAYDPKYYNFKLPIDYPTPPSGRASDPMPGANGDHKLCDSLEPRDLALGQIVPYEVEITVNGSTAPEGGIINFTCLWDTLTTNKDAFGFDPAYKVFAAFVDNGDTRNMDNGTLASAKINSSVMDGSNIKGTFEVSGLDNGDKIIVEMWVVLQTKLPDQAGGNVQAILDSAETAAGETISSGNRTIPLMRPSDFTTVTADVSIVKADAPDPIYTGDTLTYTITVTNNSTDTVANGIDVADTLDPKVTFVSASGGGTLNGGLITWPEFALEPLTQRVFNVTVNINSDAPTDICTGTAPAAGSAVETRLNNVDISNIVRFTMTITKDSNPANNVWQEPTNILPKASITAYKVWVGGPTADHQPVALTLYRHVGSGTPEVVTGVTPIITPSVGTADKFTYIWTGLPMYDSKFQPYIYTVDEAAVPEGYTKKISDNNTITNIYKPSLTILKVYGTGPLEGATFELYAGDAGGPTGGSPVSITTGLDGKATFEHLADRTYWLVEAKPPTGYKRINNIGPFIVSNGTITGPAGYTPSADGATGNYIVTVQNEPVGELPAAGGTGAVPFAIAGLGLMIFAISLGRREKIYR